MASKVDFLLLSALLVASAFAGSTAGASAGSPVQKVIELMDECKAKIDRDLAAESKGMEEYASFCDDEASEKTHALAVSGREIADLEAAIESSTASIANYEDEIKELGSLSAAKHKELYDATNVREERNSDFLSAEKDMIASIDELSGAVAMIKKQASLAQVRGGRAVSKKGQLETDILQKIINAQALDVGGRSKLKAFVQSQDQASASEDDDLSFKSQLSQAPVEGGSENGGILMTMESMQTKAEDTLGDLRKKEMDAAHSFDLVRAGLEDEIAQAATKLSTATSGKAATEEAMGKANGSLVEATKGKAADEEYLATFKRECQNAAKKWEERQRSAVGELGAIAKAKEILLGGVKVGFVQVQLATKARGDGEDDDVSQSKRQQLVQKLREISKDHKSFALSQLATRAASDPFGKIRGLIENMIEKLLKKAQEDATQEAFCQEEMGKSTKSHDDKSAKLADYQSRMDMAESSINQLSMAIAELQSEIKDTDHATAEATKVRSQEHSDFLQTSADFRGSATAVAKAIEVLKDYYEGASFVQESSDTSGKFKQPSLGGAQSDSAHGIISVLEMSEQEFTASLAECEATEDEAAEAFKKLTQENRVSRATKSVAVKSKESEVKSLKVSLAHHSEDHAAIQEELDSVIAYLSKLKPQCESKVMSYAEKKAAREAEINGLKDAIGILEGSAASLVQLKKHLRKA